MPLSDQEIKDYYDWSLSEQSIQNTENELLHFFKSRYIRFPTEENNQDWLNFSEFVFQRRRVEYSCLDE